MAAGKSDLERRVSRLENDRDSMYEILTDIGSTLQEHSRRFDRVDQRFDGIDQRLDGMDRRFDGIDQQLVTITSTLTEVVRRLPEPS